MKKIEALKAEKENNNLDSDLPSPPPQIPRQQPRIDHQGNYDNDNRYEIWNLIFPAKNLWIVIKNSGAYLKL